MSLKIYNTLTRKKEDFKPINPPKVNMYVCGVTVYDDCHLGHARALINFDVIYRYLQFAGYDVNYVRNYTDIDDKIINRARELKVAWTDITTKYIASFNEDMKALGNQKPTNEPKATENIDEIIKLIEGLMEKGFAYLAGKDVFYSVRKKRDYGKLSGKKIDELESGSRIEVHEEKKDPLDFCLWKSSKEGEPSWDSPFGAGRPGWHIECSAMSMRFLGENFDIHGGGRDLSFPHHENEIAQSEAYSGKTFANYWVHNGFININAEKMSKSLGNFTKIKELLELYHPEILRLFILSSHYRSPIDYNQDKMKELRKSLTRWYSLIQRIDNHPLSENDLSKFEKKLLAGIEDLKKEFITSMNDDFNSAKAIGFVFEQIKEFNKLLDTKKDIHPDLKNAFFDQMKEIHQVLGIFGSKPESFLDLEKQRVLTDAGLTDEIINQKLLDRKEARDNKDWGRADEIRNELADLGIQIKDHPDGSSSFSF
jgi:cysteinyl-tRNA synthetase